MLCNCFADDADFDAGFNFFDEDAGALGDEEEGEEEGEEDGEEEEEEEGDDDDASTERAPLPPLTFKVLCRHFAEVPLVW